MTELLAPAGNMEALRAAVSNGCDAVYLGMQRFGARAYSSNFDEGSLREAVEYAHLRGVRIYVTMNTIVFEDELADMKEQLEILNDMRVDGIIVQDMAVFDHLVRNYADMEAHCSTQMGIDDLEAAFFWKEMGARRLVLARELPIERVREIKKKTRIPVEIFIHGALCVSYSGNCLMSGLIGYRSGNRGRCVGSCRKLYDLIESGNGRSYGKSYLLSTKDLNTIDHIEELREIDSLKIEGRMKEPAYVANVVSKYRSALDGTAGPEDREALRKTFNRTYTEGYLFNEDKKDITNILRPNNYGYEIGRITGYVRGRYEITLTSVLNQNDIIRIDHNNEDVNLSVVKLYDREGMLINRAEDICYIKVKEKLSAGDIVYKTKDIHYYKKLETMLDREFRRYDLCIKVYAYPDAPLVIEGEGLGQTFIYESEEVLDQAINNPTGRDQVEKQLSKLNDTVFRLNDLEFEEYGAFIPSKLLNNARREIVKGLYKARLASFSNRRRDPEPGEKISFASRQPYLTAAVYDQDQYDACVRAGIKEIYFDNIVRRNQNDSYPDREGKLLIGGYGGIYRYKDTNPFVTDYSLNVVNSASVYKLHSLGAERVTLSYELNKKQIRDLVDAYTAANDGLPALEMIVYGRAPLLFTKYCPLKKLGLCGECRKKAFELRDEHGSFPVISHDDCTTTILNGRMLNLLDEMPSVKGVEAFRLNFTLESPEEVTEIVRKATEKLEGKTGPSAFDQETDTRGHFNKEII